MSKESSALPIDDVILSEREAARILGISNSTLTNWRLAGQGPPYFRVGGKTVRYSKTRLLEWLQARSVEGAEIKKVEGSES